MPSFWFAIRRSFFPRGLLIALGVFAGPLLLAQAPQIVQLNSAQLWRRVEFQANNIPAATNRFDPDVIRLDATFTAPSGRVTVVPGFWYQNYVRSLASGSEQLSPSGVANWRIRFTPQETGNYLLTLAIVTNGIAAGPAGLTNFTVLNTNPPARSGYVEVAPGHQHFRTGDGQPLRLIGENVCWPGGRGTYDYDNWFPAMQSAGENFARLWMCPWAFGIECEPGTLGNYRLDRAWQLDYVVQLAEQRGIQLLLCLDYHGMFQTVPDYWGGNNQWKTNPYNSTNGGPCLAPNAFFTNPVARSVYQKRLRYLVARYGYSPNLLAWEFFNEIDNSYNLLNAGDVATWHGLMGAWLRTNDPFGHLITTSLTGSSDRPEIWQAPQLDFASYHSYGEAQPATKLATISQSFLTRYGKPVMIGEFGVNFTGWDRASDPYLRGFRQAVWGAAVGGSTGTAMSWWWENIHSENVYPLLTAVGNVFNRTGWGSGSWSAIGFPSEVPPADVGDLIPGGTPFVAQLNPSSVWGGMPNGAFAVPSPEVTGNAAASLNGFIHGAWHTELKRPFRLSAWLTNSARLVLHVNSVADAAQLQVRADGATLFSTNLPNLDGAYSVNNEYNMDIPVNLPVGRRLIEITNAGGDWVFLDWVRLEQVLPATYTNNWTPKPEVVGLRGPRESLLYVVAPNAAFPSQATNVTLPLQHGQVITITNWPAGNFFAEWYEPTNGIKLGVTKSATTNGMLTLPLPDFREDLAGIVYSRPTLKAGSFLPPKSFSFQLLSETGGSYEIQRSFDLENWLTFAVLTNTGGTNRIQDSDASQPAAAYRAIGVR